MFQLLGVDIALVSTYALAQAHTRTRGRVAPPAPGADADGELHPVLLALLLKRVEALVLSIRLIFALLSKYLTLLCDRSL